MSYIGIDIGTTGCKAVGFKSDGSRFDSAYREYPIISLQPGWAELDSTEVMEKCFETIKSVAVNASGKIRAIGISSQGEAFTPVGKDGSFLGNGMVSSDARAASISEKWSREFGRKKLYEITGHTAHPMFTLFKLLWIKKYRPNIWKKTWKFLCYEDLLELKLGIKEPAMGWPMAGRTMLFDVRKHEWSSEILSSVGLSESKLARPLKSGSVAGQIPSNIAKSLSLPEDVIVVTGGHDQPCGALGAGVVSPGISMHAAGTVECICPAFSSPVMSEELFKSNLSTYDHAMGGMYATVAFSLTGGNILKWFRDEFGCREIAEAEKYGLNAYELLLKNMAKKPTNLLTLPYFTPTGTPHFDTKASGAIIGLKLTTKKEEILRSLLEAVALEMRLNLELLNNSGIEIRELRTVGGGSKSRIWSQLKADAMNKPITAVEEKQAGCLGVAMLARSADTGEELGAIVNRWVKTSDIIKPNPEFAGIYSEKFEKYKKLYPALKGI